MNADDFQVVLYTTPDGETNLDVRADGETVWLNRQQLAALFGRDVKTIGKHIANARREELDGMAVVAKFATTATDGKVYQTEHYNLDMVLSVGYRVKSPEGVRFRRWATNVLRGYVSEGVVLNERRLEQLGTIVKILGRSPDPLVAGVAELISRYLPSLRILRDYDDGDLGEQPGREPAWTLTLDEARSIIAAVRADFETDTLFGGERGDALAAIIGAIYQGFAGHEMYASVEEKAANLLYLVVKDHPLTDGNKRSGAALFVTFLIRNGMLVEADSTGINNNTLAAITLLVAMSDPREKELMIALIIRMISEGASGPPRSLD
ncbi:virulence protein RhuM/Fic/DOC family protein [Microbacterium esteraromaticum]|uniref:virulence protein RhuM/Fic/DOC family protein n=1 Tax=Microbacterium esteraromaticum TaxID=57043 RepID=UPI002367D0E8|nr:virulence protein RhuM/Fic/DOC family protein [Microbacterium esteraromaticum]WDH78778.1 virulence protein RhuM/Fic/DOC family protein [Microbacterium esteraromaticum]